MSKIKDQERVEIFFDGSYAVKNHTGMWTVKLCTQAGKFEGSIESTTLERAWYLASIIAPHSHMLMQEKKKRKTKLKVVK